MGIPDLIYCADGNPEYAKLAVELGWLYGARLPSTVYMPVYFADQDWKKPNLSKYVRALREHKPTVATVLDWERPDQFQKVMQWARLAARHVDKVVIIPKVPGRVGDVPEKIGGKPVILGYSVPTSYGGTPCGVFEFGDRPVHLLGGSPHEQMNLYDYMNVVSADGNMAAQQSRKGRFWDIRRTDKGNWNQLNTTGDERETGVPVECFRRSMVNIKKAWEWHCSRFTRK